MFRYTHAPTNFTSAMNTRNGAPTSAADVPKNVGRTILVGGSVVAAGLIGFYYTMLANKKREQAAGRNPYHEQVVASLSRKTVPEDLDESTLRPFSPTHPSSTAQNPRIPGRDHHSGHQTIGNFNRLHGRGAPGTQSITGMQYESQGLHLPGGTASTAAASANNAEFGLGAGPVAGGGSEGSHTLGDDNVALDRSAEDEPVAVDSLSPLAGTSVTANSNNLRTAAEKRGIDALRYMVPPPQRGRNDGSGKAYTKSPDYAKNYHKTSAGTNRVLSVVGESAAMQKQAEREAREGVLPGAPAAVPLTPKLV